MDGSMGPIKTDLDLDRFEDFDDMFDFIIDDFQKSIRRWIVFSKLNIEEDDGELSWEVLASIIKSEFDDQYKRVFPLIEKRKGGNLITAFVVEHR